MNADPMFPQQISKQQNGTRGVEHLKSNLLQYLDLSRANRPKSSKHWYLWWLHWFQKAFLLCLPILIDGCERGKGMAGGRSGLAHCHISTIYQADVARNQFSHWCLRTSTAHGLVNQRRLRMYWPYLAVESLQPAMLCLDDLLHFERHGSAHSRA